MMNWSTHFKKVSSSTTATFGAVSPMVDSVERGRGWSRAARPVPFGKDEGGPELGNLAAFAVGALAIGVMGYELGKSQRRHARSFDVTRRFARG
jgi:hypothetical protein